MEVFASMFEARLAPAASADGPPQSLPGGSWRRSLRVAVVTETYPPEVNGVAKTIGRMVDGLRELGHQVTVIRPRQAGESLQENIDGKTFLVEGGSIPGYADLRFGFPAVGRLRRLWLAQRPDVVQLVTEGPLGWAALRAARRMGIPVISEFHTNFDAYSQFYRIGWLEPLITAYLRRIHNRSNMTLVPTETLANELRNKGFERVRVLARGIDTRQFNPARRSNELRTAWGATENTPVVAYVGRLAAEKNLSLLISAFKAIRLRAPEAVLLVVGDGPEREALRAALPDACFAGMRHGEDLAAHYASADLFLFPSETETYGNVTLEALSSGLPVIAMRSAAAAELIVCGENGYAAAPGNRDDFIRAAVAYVAAPVTSREMRARIAQSVALLSWSAITTELDMLFQAVVKPDRSVHRPVSVDPLAAEYCGS